jgi:hypothetical protein
LVAAMPLHHFSMHLHQPPSIKPLRKPLRRSISQCARKGYQSRGSHALPPAGTKRFGDPPLESRVAERPAAIRRSTQIVEESVFERNPKQRPS